MSWLMGERTSDDPRRPNNPTVLTYVRGVSSHDGGMKGIHGSHQNTAYPSGLGVVRSAFGSGGDFLNLTYEDMSI